MSKTFRLSFDKGINVVGDKAILPEGFSTIMDNVDLRSGSPRPYMVPSYLFPVTATNTRSWSYRSRWFHSDNWRDYVGEFIGGIERVYVTEEGNRPSKFIGGTQVLLGTPRPLVALGVGKTSALSPGGLTATITVGSGNLQPGERLYRVSARTLDGILPPTAPVSITIPTPSVVGTSVVLTWGQVPKAVSYIIFEGTLSSQLRLDEIPSSNLSYTDTGSKTASGDNASQYLQEQELTYAYSYLRNVNGVFDEGGLSSLSVPLSSATGRQITRDFINDGYLNQLQLNGKDAATFVGINGSIPVASATSYPPLELTETASVASNALTVGKAYKILTVGSADYKTVGATDNTIGTRFYATGTSAGAGGTVIESIAFYEPSNTSTKFNKLAHGLVTGDKVYFSGFTDTVWNQQTYEVIYIDVNNFAVKNVNAPTDVSPWGATTRYAQPVKSIITNYSASRTESGATVAGYVQTGNAVYLVGSGTGGTLNGLYKATYISNTSFSIPFLSTGLVTLSSLKWIPNNGYYWKWNLYRNEQGIWNLVDAIDPWISTYTDAKPYAALGGTPTSYYSEGGITVDYNIPPFSMTGIVSHYGMKFGISGHDVRWTPPLVADAWPEVYSVTLPYQPVALSSFAQGLIILCEDAIYRLDGNTPSGMSLSKTYAEDGCFAPHSVQKTDRGLVYLGRRGIMLFDGTKSICLTDTRIPGRVLTAPSRLATAYPFWWMPTIMTRNYADLAGEDGIKGNQYSFTLDNTQTIEGYNKAIKSFYYQGAYYLFYSGADYAANTAFCIDFQLPEFPITTLGMKILDAHVNEYEQAYILCDNAPSSMSVSFVVTDTPVGPP